MSDTASNGSEAATRDESAPLEGAEATPWYKQWAYIRKLVLPVVLAVASVLVVVFFHEALLPFVFAFAIVYLMEPVVQRFSRTASDPRGLPRWITVILVYLVFFGVVTVSGLLIVPRFVGEVVRLGDTLPRNVRTFRQEKLPGFNQKVQQYLTAFIPGETTRSGIRTVRERLEEARDRATGAANTFGLARARLHRAADLERVWGPEQIGAVEPEMRPRRALPRLPALQGAPPHGRWQLAGEAAEPAFRIVRSNEDTFELYLESEQIAIERVDDGTWTLERTRSSPRDDSDNRELRAALDLESRLDRVIESAVTFSSEQLASLIEFVQHLIVGILEAFVAIILTFMVAAFISIDLPRLMSFLRSLVPGHLTPGYDQLLGRLDEGLAGVVRGQLIICLINGIFTYVGLVLLDVKFSVLLAIVAGVFSIIPVFGAVISTIPICLIALTQSFVTAVLMLGWILLIHFVEANMLNPKIIGTSAEIHPAIVIFALLAGETTFGLVGAILAVPTASIVLTLFKFTRDKLHETEAEQVSTEGESPG